MSTKPIVDGHLKWQKSSFRGSFQIFIEFSICITSNEIKNWECAPNKVVHSINENDIRFTQKYAFLGKNRFLEILKILRICWSDLVDSIGFLEALDMD